MILPVNNRMKVRLWKKVIFKDEKEPPHRWTFFSFTKTPMYFNNGLDERTLPSRKAACKELAYMDG